MNALVDTSVWSLSLRRKAGDLNAAERLVVQELADLIVAGRARLMGPVRQEVLSGIRHLSQFERLRSYLRAFPDLPISTSDYESAAEASNRCVTKGITVSVVDALICAVALNRDWTIFTTDTDFARYAGILSVKLHAPYR